jgi:hypothetical protein
MDEEQADHFFDGKTERRGRHRCRGRLPSMTAGSMVSSATSSC